MTTKARFMFILLQDLMFHLIGIAIDFGTVAEAEVKFKIVILNGNAPLVHEYPDDIREKSSTTGILRLPRRGLQWVCDWIRKFSRAA